MDSTSRCWAPYSSRACSSWAREGSTVRWTCSRARSQLAARWSPGTVSPAPTRNASAFVKTGSTTQWQAYLAPKEMAASDMRNTIKSEIDLFTINNYLHHWTPNILSNNSIIQYSDSPKYLGVTLDPALT
ncbi:hypothetical protein LAZ67_20001477 [Cordylochernes scorpioides]|uniref:Uncharacterized protein n=1 Tax=Cordylochernes scorpioides TaxID=51811 RepID=A0ABY6LK04_9ARAC|nr:hypothetical protein LAZ67_20001477 [Cordylochernes scorpioides]